MSSAITRIALLLLGISVIAGCATVSVDLPAITEAPTGERQPGKIVWRDLLTNDPAASQRFYGELFGWEFENIGLDSGLSGDAAYTLIRHNGVMIGGMIDTLALNGRDDISQWVVLMSVEDIESAAAEFESAGGTVVTPPTSVARRGTIAVVRDAEGALLGLLQTRDGDPVDREPELGGFLWDELWTSDVDKAATFFADLAGLSTETVDADGDSQAGAGYRLMKSGDRPRVGILTNPLDGLDPVWVSYLRVSSPAAITARVDKLGGRVIVEAQPRPLGGEVAFIAGPSGAGIALQTWPLTGAE